MMVAFTVMCRPHRPDGSARRTKPLTFMLLKLQFNFSEYLLGGLLRRSLYGRLPSGEHIRADIHVHGPSVRLQ
jgi:hypothetical protein